MALFYYSNGGKVVQGPVDQAELIRLLGERAISGTTYLCRAGDTTWQQLDAMDSLAPVESLAGSTAAGEAGAPASPIHDEAAGKDVAHAATVRHTPFSLMLSLVVCLVVILTAVGFLPDGFSLNPLRNWGALGGGVVFLALLPLLIPRFHREPEVMTVVVVGMVTFAAAAVFLSQSLKKETGVQVRVQQYISDAPDDSPLLISADKRSKESIQHIRAMGYQIELPAEFVEKVKACDRAKRFCLGADTQQLTERDGFVICREAYEELKKAQLEVMDYVIAYDASHVQVPTSEGEHYKPGACANFWRFAVFKTDLRLQELALMNQEWGRWRMENGGVVFENKAAQRAYDSWHSQLVQMKAGDNSNPPDEWLLIGR